MASIASLSSFSSLSLLPSLPSPSSTPSPPFLRLKPLLPALTLTPTPILTLTHCTSEDTDPTLSNDADADKDKADDEDNLDFSFSRVNTIDFDNPKPEHEVAAAYEELYGPAYSGVSVLGNDIYVMDAKFNKDDEALGIFEDDEDGGRIDDGYEERVVQVKRVTKVVKGGKNMSFRAVVVVGNMRGRVGVGMGKAWEVADAIKKAATNGRRNIIEVPLSKDDSFPHR